MANWVDARGKLIEDVTDIAGENLVVNGQPVSSSNPLPIAGTFSAEPPVGGATEAKQDVIIARLPTALGTNGGLKVSIVDGAAGGGGAGDASAANQTTQITLATELNNAFGDPTDAAAGSDAGTNTYISLFKRLLTRLTFFINLFPTSIGAKTGAASLSVVPATDATFPVPGVATATNQSSQITIETAIRDRLPTALGTNGGMKVDIVGGSAGGGGTASPEAFIIKTSFTRSAAVTAYAQNQVIGPATTAVLTFDFAAAGVAAGGSVIITGVTVDYTGAFTTSIPWFKLFLSPVTFTALADYAAFSVPDATRKVGQFVKISETDFISNGLVAEASGLYRPVTLNAGSTVLTAALVSGSASAFTPPATTGTIDITLTGIIAV